MRYPVQSVLNKKKRENIIPGVQVPGTRYLALCVTIAAALLFMSTACMLCHTVHVDVLVCSMALHTHDETQTICLHRSNYNNEVYMWDLKISNRTCLYPYVLYWKDISTYIKIHVLRNNCWPNIYIALPSSVLKPLIYIAPCDNCHINITL